jgi:predicted ribosomally synthesized peptide with SipW-like signal peptide
MTRDSSANVTRRRLLSSLTIIGSSALAGGVGTWALFEDREQTRGRIQAGTLELAVDDGGEASVSIGPVSAGDAGEERIPLSNEGTLAGDLRLTIVDISVRAGDGTQSAVLEELSVEVGFGSGDPVVAAEVDSLPEGHTFEIERTLAPSAASSGDDETTLYVRWSVPADAAVDGGSVTIDLRPELHSTDDSTTDQSTAPGENE